MTGVTGVTGLVAVAIAAIAAIAAAWLARRTWLLVTVTGDSMAPTLRDGERLLARRVRTAPRRHDIVVFRLPAQVERDLESTGLPLRIKRVAAVAGDPLPEWLRATRWAAGATHVPPGKLVVAGDNPRSQGSRELGYTDLRDVIAVVRR